MRRGNGEPLLVEAVDGVDRLEEASDLGRENVGLARIRGERLAEAPLGEAEPVVRSGVEVAHTEMPRGVHRGARVLVRDRAVEVAELRAAERQLADCDSPACHMIFIC